MNLSQTGLLYNPQLLSAEMVEKLFIVRQKNFELLLNKILQEKNDSIPQHYLIIGQRGMGKTTLLKRIEVELHKEQYRKQFIPLLYREEQYNVKDIAEFWLNTLDALADSLQSENYPIEEIAEIDKTIRGLSKKSSELISEEAHKCLMSICTKLHRRPILLIDNIDLIFSRLDNDKKDKTEQWALRKLLSEKGSPIVISGGVTHIDGVNKYGMPFYDYFQIHQLYKLNYEEFTKLLLHLATVTKSDKKVFISIQKNRSRQKSLLELTGGSPRLTVMLFEQIAKGFSSNIYDDLEKLADSITPLYKARFEELSPQQQIIVDAIALNWDAISISELSETTRMQNNQLSSQLKRLVDDGWLETTFAYKNKGNAYFISERFFNIYYLIRNSSRRHKDKIYCLSRFLEYFYGKEELERIANTLSKQEIHSLKEMQLQMAFWNIDTLDEYKKQQGFENMSNAFLNKESEDLRKEFDFPQEDYLFAEGRKLFDKKKFEEALEFFDKSLEINTDDEDTWFWKSYCLTEMHRYEEAIVCYDKIIKINPTSEDAWGWKSDCLIAMQRHEEAVVCYDKIIKMNPNSEKAWFSKSNCLSIMQRHEEAVTCCNEFIKLNPNNENALLWKGYCLSEMRHYEEALVCYDEIITINLNNEKAWFSKGNCLTEMHRYEEALVYFDKAIKINPSSENALGWKSDCLIAMQRHEEAVVCYDKIIEMNPTSKKAWAFKGHCLFNMEQYEKASVCYDEAIKLNPNDENIWLCRGICLTETQRHEEALVCYEESIKINPNDEYSWFCKGICLNEVQRYKEALVCHDKAIKLNPKNILSWFGKAECLFKLLRYEEAIECYDKVTQLDGNYQKAWSNKGFILIEMRRYEEASFAYEKSRVINNKYLFSKFQLLFLYRDKLEKMNEAVALFDEIEKEINNDGNKKFVCGYYQHKALFELYERNQGISKEHLLQAFIVLEKERKILSIANEYWWSIFGSVVIDLGYGSWLLGILEEKGYDVVLSPYYTAIQALEIEKQGGKNGKDNAEIYLKNRAVEIGDPARKIADKMRNYMN